ncbi:pentatricopeptide repeat-containing protein At5g27110 isoform X1 [Selaginella moellendorffii]|uniref:pentatricopeptide repeat-containing protein At5g27110 isoform X1 n=1 Tax=Selaginella moellendorffii TaxID=88036 RepID=UPI000D1C748E|nr:pentatricopeptide repeat-containing protein At5g27110 isoform X1 [Selaginella moellendorffii]XP_024536686.1 pentatricopeptide repeat-containing protein At5g27110 isoform X1 [Selaginella moellendorffii]XP_024536687.1 pentatricopeptide repeat-containing protein At5g27110 isoform X1 [Selaginella moellendorffii]XP_024536688.1 pentatricopeptide repeat-containing protein At5g27110 isoform X1 [Selaginella moellendorffii]|eukprot:XP_024536685.1 pentatricopeptide repeat-containing protein At5g27110 isoform X1 [Selaginella moellendorffii]
MVRAPNTDATIPVRKYFELQERGCRPSLAAIIFALKACKLSRDLVTGKKIHGDVMHSGDVSNLVVANSLLDMYVKCGCISEARELFDRMEKKDVISWTSIILGLAKHGYGDQALDFYSRMEEHGCPPDRVTVLAALKACSAIAENKVSGDRAEKVESLRKGKEVHARAARIGVELDTFAASSLVDMYAKCGRMVDAARIFESLQELSVVLWTGVILGYAQSGDGDSALEFFSRMKAEGHEPDRVTLLAALKSCASAAEKESLAGSYKFLEKGRAIFCEFQKARSLDLSKDIVLATTLVDMLSKCGSMVDARRVFENVQHRDVVLWNSIILGYAQSGQAEVALTLYSRMRDEGCLPDCLTLLGALKACVSMASNEQGKREALQRGKVIHSHAVRYRDEMEMVFETSLVDFYGRCGRLADSVLVFQSSRQHRRMAWTAIISSHAQNGDEESALELYQFMQDEGGEPSTAVLVAILKSLSSLASKEDGKLVEGRYAKINTVKRGREIHATAAKQAKALELPVATSLVDLYAKCGFTAEARKIFESLRSDLRDDVALWNCMVLGYTESGEAQKALELYSQMIQGRGPSPDRVTLLAALKACACFAEKEHSHSLQYLKDIHARAVRFFDVELDTMLANTLLDSYAKSQSTVDALHVFERIRQPDVVSWNCIVLGFLGNGESEAALETVERMREERGSRELNSVTYVAALKACAALGALERGRRFHAEICSAGLETDTMVANSLVDFYGKCGSMAEAEEVFRKISTKTMVTWSALISGYSCQGDTDRVFELFEKMKLQEKDLQPDGVTYLSVLTACSHKGLVERGKEVFEEMWRKRGLPRGAEHYACMVDLLGRANRLDEAAELLKEMPVDASAESWMALLSACYKWRNLEVGKLAFESVLELDRGNASAYVMMSNIYSSSELNSV